jgi:hypothetical protein
MSASEKAAVFHLQHVFSAADHQMLMLVLMGTPCLPAQLLELVVATANNPDSCVRNHIAKHINVDFPKLLTKLSEEPLENREVLIKFIHAACNVETDYLVDDDGVPCIHALRRVGLVAPSGPVAWGFAVVRTKDLIADEWVLRNHPDKVPLVEGSVEEFLRQLVELTHLRRVGTAPADFNSQMEHRLYAVAKLTKWSNLRVEEHDDGQVSVVKIKTRALFDDICRNSRRDHRHPESDPKMPAIQGVNAPAFDR